MVSTLSTRDMMCEYAREWLWCMGCCLCMCPQVRRSDGTQINPRLVQVVGMPHILPLMNTVDFYERHKVWYTLTHARMCCSFSCVRAYYVNFTLWACSPVLLIAWMNGLNCIA